MLCVMETKWVIEQPNKNTKTRKKTKNLNIIAMWWKEMHIPVYLYLSETSISVCSLVHTYTFNWMTMPSFYSPIRCYFFIFHSIAFLVLLLGKRECLCVYIFFLTFFFIIPFYVMCTCIYAVLDAWSFSLFLFFRNRFGSHMFSPFQTLSFHYTAKPENNFQNYVHVALK